MLEVNVIWELVTFKKLCYLIWNNGYMELNLTILKENKNTVFMALSLFRAGRHGVQYFIIAFTAKKVASIYQFLFNWIK